MDKFHNPSAAGDYGGTMSRRKILSRSLDDLNMDSNPHQPEDEDDVWYRKDKLCKDHIKEVLDKWEQIDDEIWAKIVVLERNRRVAKAYARAPVLTVDGSGDDFDGFRIGLCAFDNPMRDRKTEELKKHIGHGAKIKMDDAGNILIKRLSKGKVYVKSSAEQGEENAIGDEVLSLPGCALEPEKAFKLFDVKKFQANVKQELRRSYPDRQRLERQCLSMIAFVRPEQELLDCPIWVLIVNMVAMHMLKSKVPSVEKVIDFSKRPLVPVPDEDPYNGIGKDSGFCGSSNFTGSVSVATSKKQPLLQDQHQVPRPSQKPSRLFPWKNLNLSNGRKPDPAEEDSWLKRIIPSKSKEKSKNKSEKYEDPYYAGLCVRVPNYCKQQKAVVPVPSVGYQPHPWPLPLMRHHHVHPHHHLHHQPMWYKWACTGVALQPNYGGLPIAVSRPGIAYIGEWD